MDWKIHFFSSSFQAFKSSGAQINHTILCQTRTDLIEIETREEEAAEIFFVEPPYLDEVPDDGKDEVRFIDTVKDPLEQ